MNQKFCYHSNVTSLFSSLLIKPKDGEHRSLSSFCEALRTSTRFCFSFPGVSLVFRWVSVKCTLYDVLENINIVRVGWKYLKSCQNRACSYSDCISGFGIFKQNRGNPDQIEMMVWTALQAGYKFGFKKGSAKLSLNICWENGQKTKSQLINTKHVITENWDAPHLSACCSNDRAG